MPVAPASLIPNQQQVDMTKRTSSINDILYSPTMGNFDPRERSKFMSNLFGLFFK